MSYRWYFRIAKMMHTGRLKIPTTRQMTFPRPHRGSDWSRNPPARPMTAAALPTTSHLSWTRRSPVARRQLST